MAAQPPLPSKPPENPPPALALASSRGGATNPFLKISLAVFITSAVIAAYVYSGQKPQPITGEVTQLTAYPIHQALVQDPHRVKVVGTEQSFDQTVVLAQVKLHNQTEGPIFLRDIAATVRLPDQDQRSLAATRTDFPHVFLAYPSLAPARRAPLLRDITIPAGATTEGQLIFNYPITQAQWEARREVKLTLSFTNRNDLVLTVPAQDSGPTASPAPEHP